MNYVVTCTNHTISMVSVSLPFGITKKSKDKYKTGQSSADHKAVIVPNLIITTDNGKIHASRKVEDA